MSAMGGKRTLANASTLTDFSGNGAGCRRAHGKHLPDSFDIRDELTVRRLGFGAMRLVGPEVYGEPADSANSLAVLRRAVALGVNLIDIAEAHGPEINERQIAEALAP